MTVHLPFSRVAVAALFSGVSALSSATTPIPFDPDGAGSLKVISVASFDWAPDSALAVNGNPAGGLITGDVVQLLSHARLGLFTLADGTQYFPPAGTEFTFVTGFAERATVNGSVASFVFDPTSANKNFFEIWVNTPADSNQLSGTGYNNGKRIMLGMITDALGNFVASPVSPQALDQNLTDNYPGILTIVGSGSTQLTGVIISADADYFPGLTPAMLANTKVFFNTSTVTPYFEADPSAAFVTDKADPGVDGPAPDQPANVGPINGLPNSTTGYNFIFQSDANQSADLGVTIPGACRVTYGGNDKNGNVDLTKFGNACASDSSKTQNCYTFGGQVGAPTGDPTLGGPFGEHTHHQVSGPAGDFVFRAGTHSAPKATRITAMVCKDPGAIRQAEANAGFKQIDFEGTGSFRTMDATAKAYLIAHGAPSDINTDNVSDKKYYFRVDMVDAGEPGNKTLQQYKAACTKFFNADQNYPLSTPDPLLGDYVPVTGPQAGPCADIYQMLVCKDDQPCDTGKGMYEIRGFLLGGNVQIHKVIK